MSNIRIFFYVVFFGILHFPISAQEISGRAFYTSFFQMDYKLDDEKQNDPQEQALAKLFNQPFVDKYELAFTGEESLFKKLPQLDKPDPKEGRYSVSVSMMGDEEILYKDLKENKMINETELYGKLFLIQDELQARDWKLSNENKTIGNYICFKATYLPKSEEKWMEDDKEKNEIIAWYTPQIPVKNGPKNYGGLPGLILELQDGELKFLCTKIVINPDEAVTITKPKKGKKVSQKEFKAIMDKKNDEMQDSFHTTKRRN